MGADRALALLRFPNRLDCLEGDLPNERHRVLPRLVRQRSAIWNHFTIFPYSCREKPQRKEFREPETVERPFEELADDGKCELDRVAEILSCLS